MPFLSVSNRTSRQAFRSSHSRMSPRRSITRDRLATTSTIRILRCSGKVLTTTPTSPSIKTRALRFHHDSVIMANQATVQVSSSSVVLNHPPDTGTGQPEQQRTSAVCDRSHIAINTSRVAREAWMRRGKESCHGCRSRASKCRRELASRRTTRLGSSVRFIRA